MKYVCESCGWVYNEARGDINSGIAPGTCFEKLPPDYECPCCFSEKEAFQPVEVE